MSRRELLKMGSMGIAGVALASTFPKIASAQLAEPLNTLPLSLVKSRMLNTRLIYNQGVPHRVHPTAIYSGNATRTQTPRRLLDSIGTWFH